MEFRVTIHHRTNNEDDPWGSNFSDRVIWAENIIEIIEKAEKAYSQYRISHSRWVQDPLKNGRMWAQLLVSNVR